MDECEVLPETAAKGGGVERGVKLTILPYPSHAEENHSEVHLTARLAPRIPSMAA